ncbi:hypothetical protein [Nocardia gipuzkoensis]
MPILKTPSIIAPRIWTVWQRALELVARDPGDIVGALCEEVGDALELGAPGCEVVAGFGDFVDEFGSAFGGQHAVDILLHLHRELARFGRGDCGRAESRRQRTGDYTDTARNPTRHPWAENASPR